MDDLGNSVNFASPEAVDLLTGSVADGYNEYAISITTDSPDTGFPRMDVSSYDVLNDDTPLNYNDNLFNSYADYTQKLELSITEATTATTATTSTANARTYGLLSSAYLGVDKKYKSLYVLGNMGVVDEMHPIEVGNGLQSKELWLSTSDKYEEAYNNIVLLADGLTVAGDLIEIEGDTTKAVIPHNKPFAGFRVSAT